MPDVLRYEKEAWSSGFLRVAGVDEAGRGPLAGPVVAAAVFFDPASCKKERAGVLKGLTDSKALSEKKRNTYFDYLMASHASIGVGIVESPEIDHLNILNATHKAMRLALEKVAPDFALIDGLPVKGLPCPSNAIVKGDALSFSISAASVIAKVTRDRIMIELDAVYPVYGFAQHKGYGTRKHVEALRTHGACVAHRKSFGPVANLQQLDLGL